MKRVSTELNYLLLRTRTIAIATMVIITTAIPTISMEEGTCVLLSCGEDVILGVSDDVAAGEGDVLGEGAAVGVKGGIPVSEGVGIGVGEGVAVGDEAGVGRLGPYGDPVPR